ncbi:MAG: putative methyltransferase [Oceanicoccus sp.]|jgi:predicted methyltransferase
MSLKFKMSLLFTLAMLSWSMQAEQHMDWRAGLDDTHRPASDKKRDNDRKPADVLHVLGVKSGMKVLDLFAAGGYYTEVLSLKVGDKGEVLSHNDKFLLEVMNGLFDLQMTDRLAMNRLPNVTRFHREIGSLGLQSEIDVITFVLNYHDLYSTKDKKQRVAFLAELHAALKSDGVLGIIDSQANAGDHNPSLHRINSGIVKLEMATAGFRLVAESDVLSNSADDHLINVFDPSIRGKTDRFLLKFQKR